MCKSSSNRLAAEGGLKARATSTEQRRRVLDGRLSLRLEGSPQRRRGWLIPVRQKSESSVNISLPRLRIITRSMKHTMPNLQAKLKLIVCIYALRGFDRRGRVQRIAA